MHSDQSACTTRPMWTNTILKTKHLLYLDSFQLREKLYIPQCGLLTSLGQLQSKMFMSVHSVPKWQYSF